MSRRPVEPAAMTLFEVDPCEPSQAIVPEDTVLLVKRFHREAAGSGARLWRPQTPRSRPSHGRKPVP